MPRALVIGDVHAKVEDLDDCTVLDSVIAHAVTVEKPDCIVFLGDLYDAFAVKNVVVERWWMGTLRRYGSIPEYLVLGNHDRPGDSTALGHALQAHAGPTTFIADTPLICRELGDVVLFPFYFKAEDFVKTATLEPFSLAKTLFCHQSFIGGKYESGQPIEAKHDASAVDAAAVPQRCIIAGHIHTPQTTGKVWYPGAPRWRNNVSDANIDRHIYAIDFENSLPKAVRKYATGDVCRRIWQVKVTPEGNSVNFEQGKPGDRWVVDIHGPAAFIEQAKNDWAGPGIRIRSFQTDRPGPKLSEAEGIRPAWQKWAGAYSPKFGTSPDVLARMASERLALA